MFCGCVWLATTVTAQTRLAIIQAEDRRAQTPADLAILRSGAHSDDAPIRRAAVRALGRLERPSLIPDITSELRHALPEIRSEAANAIAQAAQGWKGTRTPADSRALASAAAALTARLKVEAEPDVRAAICQSIGRLPYSTADELAQAEQTLLSAAEKAASVVDRLGIAQGFEALVRPALRLRPLSDDSIALLRRFARAINGDTASGARVRRLAMDALIAVKGVDEDTRRAAAADADAQVRRDAMRAAPSADGLADPSPMVRLEAVRGIKDCGAIVDATSDGDMHVALMALDRLAACGQAADAVALLERTLLDLSDVGRPRGWHRAAHALVALASAAPDKAAGKLPPFVVSRVWQLRMYAARAAATIKDRATLEKLASTDDDDNVREAAVEGLKAVAGHEADAIYVADLNRPGYQIVRAAALALVDSPRAEANKPALTEALQRLVKEGHDNSHDARAAIAKALGSDTSQTRVRHVPDSGPTNEDLRRLASPRARITIRDVGTFELALFTNETPLTVIKFARLAESGYYNGLTFHRVVPNFVIQGGSPGASEYIGEPTFMRDEVGLWPHVRGAIGISTRGHDTGDAQIFVDLIDNPRLDHTYTVFAQVLNGIDVVDRILEGDVIDKVEIIP
ncbi:MAG TPA: peptidylprolyl isomerase [Vicinamibacterales bacterium]|nr:peptidylprolyl isomerase [Vicinamibacterales bacterium]